MENKNNAVLCSAAKSPFVHTLAWAAIFITGFTTFLSLVQNVIVSFLSPVIEMQRVFIIAPEMQKFMPSLVRFIFINIRLIFFGYLVFSTLMFIFSIGLLKRKNWARILFICGLFISIFSSIFCVFFQGAIMNTLVPIFPLGYTELVELSSFSLIFVFLRIVSALLVIFLVILYGWIIKKLVSADVKREFIHKDVPR